MKPGLLSQLLLFLLSSSVSFFSASLWAADDKPVTEAVEAVNVTLKRLGDITVPVERDAPAALISLNDSPLSAQLSAKVLAIKADVGDQVKQGAVLAVLECRDFNASLRQASAAVVTAKARIEATRARTTSTGTRLQSTGARINSAQARINSAQARAAAARARVPAAESQFKLAQIQLQRNQRLRADKLIPTDTLDQAQATFSTAQGSLSAAQADLGAAQAETNANSADLEGANADLAAAKADLAAAQADLLTVETELESALAQEEAAQIIVERCQITAPFAGQITGRTLQEGQIAAPGNPAFQMLQTGALELTASLSADAVKDLEQGESLRFVADGVEIPVERRAVIAQIVGNTRTQEVRFSFKGKHSLPIGKTGRVVWQGKLPAIPASWILRREGGLGLMLAVDGKARFMPLENAQEGQPVLMELSADTQLIDDNRLRVRDGQTIQRSDQ